MFIARIKTVRRRQRGSAFIMTVVLSVLLAVIGVFFVTASRVNDMAAGASADQYELESAAEAVTGMISNVLVEDLYGPEPGAGLQQNLLAPPSAEGSLLDVHGNSIYDYDYVSDEDKYYNEPWDSPAKDEWLADIEPYNADPGGYDFDWRYISDLTRVLTDTERTLVPEPVGTDHPPAGAGVPADADGDGVTDSRWFMLDNIFTSNGDNCYAAVRIIDNCGMLNLNTAYDITPDSDGSYLTSVDYHAFLRGDDRDPDNVGNIMDARYPDSIDLPSTWPYSEESQKMWQDYVFDIENPDPMCSFFDISDELEMRNRYLLTSLAIARFEREGLGEVDPIGYATFDWGRGQFTPGWNTHLRVKRIPYSEEDFYDGNSEWKDADNRWLWRVDHRNFDSSSGPLDSDNAWKYDRRHVCTFYSFDRQIRRREYPALDNSVSPYICKPSELNKVLLEMNEEFYLELVDESLYLMDEGPFIAPHRKPGFSYNIFPDDIFIDEINDVVYGTHQARIDIIRLLYGLKYYFMVVEGMDHNESAKKAAQIVVNIVDYSDPDSSQKVNPLPIGSDPTIFADNTVNIDDLQKADDPSYINKNVINNIFRNITSFSIPLSALAGIHDIEFGLPDTLTVYGYEKQPFISEIARYYQAGSPPTEYYAIELSNPYDSPIELGGWQVEVGGSVVHTFPAGYTIEAKDSGIPGRIVITDNGPGWYDTASPRSKGIFTSFQINSGDNVYLKRPDPANPGSFITVDKTTTDQANDINDGTVPLKTSQRDERGFRASNQSYYGTPANDPNNTTWPVSLGKASGFEYPNSESYPLPVDNSGRGLTTLEGLVSVLKVGSSAAKTITEEIAGAALESDIRFDFTDTDTRKVFEYVTILNRDEGTLPGRININTAPMYVLRAAIPINQELDPGLTEAEETWNWNELAEAVYAKRYEAGGNSFENVCELIDLSEFNTPRDGSDFDNAVEKHSILSQVFNKYTVRSDVFTAYILVRLGEEGPMKRWTAIFDRSGVTGPDDRPKIVAMHPVPNPR